MGLKVGAFGIPESDFQKLDQPLTESTVRLRERQGGGFEVKLEVFHQLHCLVSILNTYFFQPAGRSESQLTKLMITRRTFYDNLHTRNTTPLEPRPGKIHPKCSAPISVRHSSHKFSPKRACNANC